MVSADDRRWYKPPPFPLFEFDDSALPCAHRQGARRWIPGFSGAIGEPAQNVELGWRSLGGAQVAIRTFSDNACARPDSWARESAVLILSGLQFASPGPPVRRVVASGADVKGLAEQDELWHESELVVNVTSTRAVAAVLRGLHVGYAKTGDVVIAFVAGGIGNGIVQVRSLSADSEGYVVDPRTPLTLTEVDHEWQDFFHERPDLELEPVKPPTG